MISIIKSYANTTYWERNTIGIDKHLDCLANVYRISANENRKINGVKCQFFRKNMRGTALINFEIKNNGTKIVALSTLVLGGICDKVDLRYCLKFQKKELPVPYLEFIQRPLFYHYIFRLTEDMDRFYNNLPRILTVANAASLAFLRKCCPNKFKIDKIFEQS